jgi:hypothetical protein
MLLHVKCTPYTTAYTVYITLSQQYLDWDIGTEAQRKNFISGYWDLQYITTHGRRLLNKLWQTEQAQPDESVNSETAQIVTTAGN